MNLSVNKAHGRDDIIRILKKCESAVTDLKSVLIVKYFKILWRNLMSYQFIEKW